jgi:hypothetical protein
VQFQPANDAVRDEAFGFMDGVRPARRVDARKRNHDVRMGHRQFDDGVVRHLRAAGQPLVDREHDAGHAARSVVLHERGAIAFRAAVAKVLRRRRISGVRTLGGFEVDVDIDGREPSRIERACGCHQSWTFQSQRSTSWPSAA